MLHPTDSFCFKKCFLLWTFFTKCQKSPKSIVDFSLQSFPKGEMLCKDQLPRGYWASIHTLIVLLAPSPHEVDPIWFVSFAKDVTTASYRLLRFLESYPSRNDLSEHRCLLSKHHHVTIIALWGKPLKPMESFLLQNNGSPSSIKKVKISCPNSFLVHSLTRKSIPMCYAVVNIAISTV